MLSGEDIEALRTADKFCERADRGLPVDRWATTEEMHKIARAITVLYAMAYMTAGSLATEQYERGLDAMLMDGETR